MATCSGRRLWAFIQCLPNMQLMRVGLSENRLPGYPQFWWSITIFIHFPSWGDHIFRHTLEHDPWNVQEFMHQPGEAPGHWQTGDCCGCASGGFTKDLSLQRRPYIFRVKPCETIHCWQIFGTNMVIAWLVVWNMNFMTFHVLGTIIPTVTHSYFSEGWLNHQPFALLRSPCWPEELHQCWEALSDVSSEDSTFVGFIEAGRMAATGCLWFQ